MQSGRNALRQALENIPATMWAFIAAVYGPPAVREAWAEFMLWTDHAERFDPQSPHLPLFKAWLCHCWAPDPSQTTIADASVHHRRPTAVFLERNAGLLDPVVRDHLHACLETPFSFHEVVRKGPAGDFFTRDLLTRAEYNLPGYGLFHARAAGDILFGQIINTNGFESFAVCGPCVIPAAHKPAVVNLRHQITSGLHRPTSHESLRKWDIEVRELYWVIAGKLLEPPLTSARRQRPCGSVSFACERTTFRDTRC